ncbi:hypothetical protein JSQ73_002810 [Wolbachia endosymbiont of Anopheles demeilloni]|uniref:hypothetical protein n=1 Tax=Wolbachia endosymbiont of Anopheles demeilloni TaxID=2748871 RepID=UPI001F29B8F4|nr:hypothetical protein [Wolbachia endosymbiont of Anopheles demeilloni]UIP93377.1 hypothetical protein JSQ73_002810 [Wolbachia endosymbiont of Anopheles demeilloni]
MPAAYSYDLRKKAMQALDEGESKTAPDFNKIEHHWFAIKNRARNNVPLFKSFHQAVDSAFLHLFPLL